MINIGLKSTEFKELHNITIKTSPVKNKTELILTVKSPSASDLITNCTDNALMTDRLHPVRMKAADGLGRPAERRK